MRAEDGTRNAVQPLSSTNVRGHIEQQLRLANYLAPPQALEKSFDLEEYSNNGLWERLIFGNARAEHVVRLHSFFLFEWMPRTPGLYFTPQAWQARRESFNHIIDYENGVAILNPAGKTSLVQAGVGSVRLKPMHITGEQWYLMSASSEGNCDQGFPVAISPADYNRYIDDIRSRGCTLVNLVGRLQYTPDTLDNIYRGSREVPQLYLKVEEVLEPTHQKSRSAAALQVSVSCLFEGVVEGQTGKHFAFVTFDPGEQGGFKQAVEWLEHSYVEKRYKGKVLTDFDQLQSNFNAPFSLDNVLDLNSKLWDREIRIDHLEITHANLALQRSTITHLEAHNMQSNTVNQSGTGNVAIVGSYLNNVTTTVSNNLAQSQASDEIKGQVKALADEISKLKDKLDEPTAKKFGKNLERLSEEILEDEPDKAWYKVSLDGLKEAAEAVGALAAPITKTLKSLWPLLLGTEFGI